MPAHLRERPETSSENENRKVHCYHTSSCTKWVSRRTRNLHWQKLLDDDQEAQGKCRKAVRGLQGSSTVLSVVDAGGSGDEHSSAVPVVEDPDESDHHMHSSSEKAAVERSEGGCSQSEESAVEEPAVELSDEQSSSGEESAIGHSDEGGSTSEESADVLSGEHSSSEGSDEEVSRGTRRPVAALQTPPLVFPASPAPLEDVLDDTFDMDQQYDDICSWYTTEELDQVIEDQGDQDPPFLESPFECDSPFPEEDESLPPHAAARFDRHSVESDSESTVSGGSALSEREWINYKREKILEDHLHDVRMFSYRVQYNITAAAVNALSTTLDGCINPPLQSIYKTEKLVQKLSDLKPYAIHMCKNSCCAFDGPFAEKDHCPFCNHARRNEKGIPYKTFQPIPLTPRLQALYATPKMAKAMRYRANYHEESDNDQPERTERPEPENEPDEPRQNAPPSSQPHQNTLSNSPPHQNTPPHSPLNDIFDGQHYRHLCEEKVQIPSGNEGGFETMQHMYFEDRRDVALGLALDGFTFFETLGKSAQKTKYNTWALILINFNLDPVIRTHRENVISLGMIPGPGSPKHIGSFLHWLRRELITLARGVRTYDGLDQEYFLLHAYLIIVIGDMPAIAHIMDMKGHIGKCPCRACWVTGKRDRTNNQSTIHYPVHTDSNRQVRHDIDYLLQHPRTHQSFCSIASTIVEARTLADAQDQRTRTGLNAISVLWGIPGINFERSFPHDLMHLIFLNACPNLVAWWTGTFKNIDTMEDDFRISIDNWKRIGQRIVDSMKLIPASFVRQLPDISTLGHTYLAEGWSFWLLYIAPYALDRILPVEYYHHLMDLVAITRRAISFDLTEQEVLTTFQDKCTKWVMEYEQLYYQYKEDRTAACTATIHAIIHLPTDLWHCGPAWVHWAFVMEREVQWSKSQIWDSRKEPFAHLTRMVHHREQIRTIMLRFDLKDQLDIRKRIKGDSGGPQGTAYDSYDEYEFLPPAKRTVLLSDNMREEIAQFVIANRAPELPGITELDAMRCVPRDGMKWGKMTVNGERITANWVYNQEKNQRRSNYVRYHVLLPGQDVQQPTVCYGRLDEIWALQMTPVPDLELYCAHGEVKTIVLALMKPCITRGRDASVEKVYYTRFHRSSTLVDISFIKAVVGRVYPFHDDGRYGIIDRLPAEQHASFSEQGGANTS